MSGLRVGLLGVGRIGAAHAEVLARHPDVSQLVLADVDAARARALGERLAATAAPSIDAIFEDGLDAVVIAASTSAHPDLLVRACQAGIPAFCEKPVAADVAGTLRVLRSVRATGVPVQIGFQRRFDAGYAAARAALARGELGELRRLHLVTADRESPPAPYIATSGGIFRDCHVHDFDILRWTTARDVVEVFATGSSHGFFRAAGDVDEAAVVLTLDGGALATMQGSRCNGGGYDARMEIAGTRATMAVGLDEHAALRSAEPRTAFPAGAPWPDFRARFGAAYVAEIDAFLAVARAERETPCSVEDALEALLVAEAAERSRREHRPVALAEVRP